MRPEDIPEDVWEKAVACTGFGGGHEMQGVIHAQRVAIARAILAERERCAKMVENFSPIRPAFETEDEGGQKWPHPAEQMPIYSPAKLAAAIRGPHAPE